MTTIEKKGPNKKPRQGRKKVTLTHLPFFMDEIMDHPWESINYYDDKLAATFAVSEEQLDFPQKIPELIVIRSDGKKGQVGQGSVKKKHGCFGSANPDYFQFSPTDQYCVRLRSFYRRYSDRLHLPS